MKVAIMQPYLFPYIGYFQLLNAVDTFVILDDVSYINRGWINRNRIIVNRKEFLFTIPINKASQNKVILDCELSDENWQHSFLKTIEMNYKKAPEFSNIFPLIQAIVLYIEKNISMFIYNQLCLIAEYLQIQTTIQSSSKQFETTHLKGYKKIISICQSLHATDYVNPIGGMELYANDIFEKESIALHFIKSDKIIYNQFSDTFIPNVSIIDVLMHNSKESIQQFLQSYSLITNAI